MVRRVACWLAVTVGVASAGLKPLPSGSGWFGDPMTWTATPDGFRCALSRGYGLNVYEAAPPAAEVTVEAIFTPAATARRGWAIAAVAIAQDARNFWHLALAETPPEQQSRPFIELVQMREGQWLSQHSLRLEFAEAPEPMWRAGQAYRLRLAMDREGITGSVAGPDGGLMMRQRYAFTGPAVTWGRPALRVGDFAGDFTAIRAAWASPVEVGASLAPVFPPYRADSIVSGLAPGVASKATGFFRVERQPDGRWWAIDPLGRGVTILGVDHVSFQGHWCEKLGYAPHGRKNEKKYPDRQVWVDQTISRLQAWGFNMLGAGCDPILWRRGLIHTEFLNIGGHFANLGDEHDITPNEQRPCTAFPNVFHPDFEAYCRFRARQICAPLRDDPWLFGYFIDNELAWWGRGGLETGLFDAVMRKGAAHTAKQALRDFVATRFKGKIEAFNACFGTTLSGFDEILNLDQLPHGAPAQNEVKRAFLVLAAERYFSIATRAIREADPNHLILGARFAGTYGAAPVVWEVAGRYCDVVTFNFYPMVDLDEGRVYSHFGATGERIAPHFARFYGHAGRPLLLTEWSFPALDAGLPSAHGAGQRFRTQAERTEATRLFALTLLSLPFMIGYDYFMWVDQPELGISAAFPEDSNYGLINEDGEPYELLTQMFAALHRDAVAWRKKPEPEARQVQRPRVSDAAGLARRLIRPQEAAARFMREGAGFRATNGQIGLAGGTGDGFMIREVSLGGWEQVFGAYNALLHIQDEGGQDRWVDATRVVSVEGRVDESGTAVLEITGAGGHGPQTFEVTHRLWLPPGFSGFVCEVVRIRNTGAAPLRLMGLFFRPYARFHELPARQPPNLWGMPEAGCWLDHGTGRFYGALAPRRSGVRIHFWLNPEGGGPHADARFELLDTAVAPGAVYAPPAPVWIVCALGTGGSDGWRQVALDMDEVFSGSRD